MPRTPPERLLSHVAEDRPPSNPGLGHHLWPAGRRSLSGDHDLSWLRRRLVRMEPPKCSYPCCAWLPRFSIRLFEGRKRLERRVHHGRATRPERRCSRCLAGVSRRWQESWTVWRFPRCGTCFAARIPHGSRQRGRHTRRDCRPHTSGCYLRSIRRATIPGCGRSGLAIMGRWQARLVLARLHQ